MIDLLANFHFIRPAMLLLAPIAIALWWLSRRHSDPLRGWREQIEAPLLAALVVGRESAGGRTLRGLPLVWLLGTVAIAGPTWRRIPNPFADAAAPLMILLKADVSMETPDPEPSRLERAQLKIVDLAEARRGQALGLIAYAGSAHLVLPPTPDTSTVATMAGEISSEIMPEPGDRLDLALRKAEQILSNGGQGGSILVIADSVETDPASISSTAGFPVQFLAINSAGSSQDESLRRAAKSLKAAVEPLAAGDKDVLALTRRASKAVVGGDGETGAQWQEAGYWLLPPLALLFLLSFRRTAKHPEVAA